MRKLLFVLLFLFLTPTVYADVCDDVSLRKPETWVDCFFEQTQATIIELISDTIETLRNALGSLIITNINTSVVKPLWLFSYSISLSLIVVFIVYDGYLWLHGTINDQKKVEAKQQLFYLILLLVVASSSFYIAKYMLLFSEKLSEGALNAFLGGRFVNYGTSESNIIFLFVSLITMIPFLLVVAMRHLVMIALLALLPLILTMYFFLPTRQMGAQLLQMFAINTFFPLLWVTILAVGGLFVASLGNGRLFVPTFILELIASIASFYICGKLYLRYGFSISIVESVAKPVGTVISIAMKVAGKVK